MRLIYLALFGVGNVIFGQTFKGVSMLLGVAGLLRFLFWDLKREDGKRLRKAIESLSD